MAGSSSLLDTPKAGISSEGLTYGVELEFVFAFHQDELLAVFDDAVYGEECFLQKHIPYCVREEDVFTPIPLIDLPNHVYNSWGIVYTEPKSKEGMMAPYQMEPMRIVGNKFSEKYPDFRYRIKPAISEEDKTKDIYHTWIITRDYSVCGVGSENIPAWLNRNNIDSGDWDSIGIEVVSRVLNSASPEGKQEIEMVVDAVKGGGNDSYGAFITNQCGLHVHVQAPQKLEELKELALILIVYEQEIARLHPPCRRPHHEAVQWIAESNRMGVMQHPPDLATGHFDCSTNALEQRYKGPIERLRAQLRDISNASALVKFMNHPANYKFPRGNRNRQVNFLSINRGDNFASTVEFRQARGSLCAEDISRWVDFCVGLVKLSKLYSEDPDRFPLKGLGRYQEPDGKLRLNLINVYALMRDMELGNEAISYWQRRIAGYQMGMHGDADDRADNELPPPELIV